MSLKTLIMTIFQKLYAQINQFFFAPSEAKNLSFLRIAIGLFCVSQMLGVYPDLLNIYGAQGFIRSEITELMLFEFAPRISWFTNAVAHLGVSEPDSVYLLAHIFIISGVGLAIGLATRLMAVMCWCCHLLLMGTGSMFSYGADVFLGFTLFYCILMPMGRYWSVDSLLWNRKSKGASWSVTAFLRVLQLHLVIAYFMGGFGKALGNHWWNGEAIWRAATLPQFNQFDMGWIASVPTFAMVMGWFVLLIECGYPLFMFHRKTRPYCLAAIVSMHIGIAIFMGLYYFAALMIILNIAAFGHPYISALEKWGTSLKHFLRPSTKQIAEA
ncbi:MAG: HTTM domain-containing protein [Bacteroidota bacterium]